MSIRRPVTLLSALLAALALTTAPRTAEAQFGRRLKDAVKRTAEDKAIQKTTETENKAIDSAMSGGGDAAAGADTDRERGLAHCWFLSTAGAPEIPSRCR